MIEGRKREIEGPFGEFTGHYSGGRNMTVVRIDKVSYRTKPIFESLYLGMPWTEIDYLMGPATCVPLYQQLKAGSRRCRRSTPCTPMACWRLSPPKNATAVCPRGGITGDDYPARPRLRENGDYGR